jgi:thioredoxin 1
MTRRVGLMLLGTLALCGTVAANAQSMLFVPEFPVKDMVTLVDLGATDCIPCKMMAPILEELGREYEGVMDVRFIDVNLTQNVPLARQHGIQQIPTQVFLSADGRELWRHEGFLAKDAILAKWNELGYDLAAPAPASSHPQSGSDSPTTTEPSRN